jgi:hypothetical protein
MSPGIRALIDQGEAASVAQQVGMREQGAWKRRRCISQEQVNGRAVQRFALLAYKERLAGRFHPGTFFQPGVTALSSSPRRGCVVDNALQPGHMQHAAFGCPPGRVSSGHAQAMPEHLEQQATVAHLVPSFLLSAAKG